MKRQTFVVVGLGLLGGSLGGALRKSYPGARVIGVSRSLAKARHARKKGFVTDASSDLSQAVCSADCVFICTPVDTISAIIREIDKTAKRGTVVTDVGSTKERLLKWAERQKFRRIRFVGSHPMAGSHLTGLVHASPDLYRETLTFVTRHRGISEGAFSYMARLWRKLCGQVVVVNGKTHDGIVAEISHLPHLVSAVLVQTVTPKILRFAGSGFKDVTRIAQGDPRIWIPIFAANQARVARLLGKFRRAISLAEVRLRQGDYGFFRRLLMVSAARRRNLR